MSPDPTYPIQNPRPTDSPPVPLAAPPRPVYDPAARPTIPDPVIPKIGTVPMPFSSSVRPRRPGRR